MNNYTCYYFYCPDCDEAWVEKWDCACDSDCPKCGKTYTPFDTKKEWVKAKTPNSIKFIKSYKRRYLLEK